MSEETKQALIQKYWALKEKHAQNINKIHDLQNENQNLLRQINLLEEESIIFLGKLRHG